MKNIIIGIIALLAVGAGAFFLLSDQAEAPTPTDTENTERMPVEPDNGIGDGAEPPTPFSVLERQTEVAIGQSVNGATITAYHFGTGDREVLVVGGIHSAFAPNTVTVAEELMAALDAGSITVPENVKVTIIPNLNPDARGTANTLAARLNADDVDLNRNFDCEWDAEGVWRSTPVSGGTAAFSEPEAAALRDYATANSIAAAVVYYAADGGVYASNCGGALDADVAALTSIYADASGYTANEEFDSYKISGDATNWMAKVGVPAIGVLLSDYTGSEFAKNKAGLEAVLQSVSAE